MRRLVVALTVVILAMPLAVPAARAHGCGTLDSGTCGVHSDPTAGQFHGLIAVGGSPWVLGTAARSGTTAGCGDCTWFLVLACPDENPRDPTSPIACAEALHARKCAAGQVLYRLYLSTNAVTDQVEGTICLGGASQVVPVGQTAVADVARYLRDVTPPAMQVSTRPLKTTLAGLPTYFTARPPSSLRPAPFGGPDITETIRIAADDVDWRFGDGSGTGWIGADHSARHTYTYGRREQASLRTRWSASYTISYDGRTFGPYDATGHLTRTQAFTLPVRTTTPVLVSG